VLILDRNRPGSCSGREREIDVIAVTVTDLGQKLGRKAMDCAVRKLEIAQLITVSIVSYGGPDGGSDSGR
jgi:hypothetical protein